MNIESITKNYTLKTTTIFRKHYKKCIKQGKDKTELYEVVKQLATGHPLEPKYKDHALINNKYYNNCRECHIEPDWLLIYKIEQEQLILLLFEIESLSEVFSK